MKKLWIFVLLAGPAHSQVLQINADGQIDRFAGNLELALAAYNAGSGRILRFEGLPPYAQTRRYVARNLDRLASQSLASTSPPGVTP